MGGDVVDEGVGSDAAERRKIGRHVSGNFSAVIIKRMFHLAEIDGGDHDHAGDAGVVSAYVADNCAAHAVANDENFGSVDVIFGGDVFFMDPVDGGLGVGDGVGESEGAGAAPGAAIVE